jgi:GAF domain-containing protein
VKGVESACGVALLLGRQYAVADVETHALFRGTPAGDMILSAGVRAVASSPIYEQRRRAARHALGAPAPDRHA